jgi:hypothetical protein
MFELIEGKFIDKSNQIEVVFAYRDNPAVDERGFDIGYYKDKINNIIFDFDVITLSSNLFLEEKGRPCAYFKYLFIDLMVMKYSDKLSARRIASTQDKITSAIIDNLNSAFSLFAARSRPRHGDAIFRIIFLNSKGIVSSGIAISKDQQFNSVDVKKMKEIFENDLKNIEESR